MKRLNWMRRVFARQLLVVVVCALGFAWCVQAASVTREQATTAARGWAVRGGAFAARVGQTVERTAAFQTTNGAPFFAVKMQQGGTVFVSGDTETEPIVAFTAETNDFSTLDRASPLWALLNRDLSVRKERLAAQQAASAVAATSGVKQASTASSGISAARRWATFLNDASVLTNATGTGIKEPSETHLSGKPGDLRVDALVKSKWGQSTVGAKNVYNYYTPELSNGQNAVCGCVATAMSQLMRYHQYPDAAHPITAATRWCTIEAASHASTKTKTNLTMQGGVYDWANMPLVPNAPTETECQAIGKLTSDAGISVHMGYDTGSSGAFLINAAVALCENFRYASAMCYSATEISSSTKNLTKSVFANLDAGYPVLMGVSGDGGHAIVGDGYGYDDSKPYVHLNMGWSGLSDFWYNLPDIDSGTYHYTVFDDVIFNIFPTANADSTILSGRITDDDGEPVEGARLVISTAEGTTVAETTSSKYGVWGVVVPAGTYNVSAQTADQRAQGERENVSVAKTLTSTRDVEGWIVQDVWAETFEDVPYVTTIGNAPTTDFVLSPPTVRIGTATYATLNKALAQAVAGDVLEIVLPTELTADATVGVSCTIVATNVNPAASAVVCSGKAKLIVPSGVTLNLSNTTFSNATATVVSVEAGGNLTLGSGVTFGTGTGVAAVETADLGGFTLAAPVTSGFELACAQAKDVGQFGTASCGAAALGDTVARIVNWYDAYGEIRGTVDSAANLNWAAIPVPLDEAAGYYVSSDGQTNCYARIDRLVERFNASQKDGTLPASAEIVIRRSGALSQSVIVDRDVTLRGENGAAITNFSTTAGFVVSNGTLSVSRLGFLNYHGPALFSVCGGNLLFGAWTCVSNAVTTSNFAAPVQVVSGTFTMLEGAQIVDCGCDQGVQGNVYGGAVYLDGEGCTFNMRGGEITGCVAKNEGGGVYAYYGSAVSISGPSFVRGNRSSAGKVLSDDVYLACDVSAFTLADALTGEVGIRWNGTYDMARNQEGGAFISLPRSVSRMKVVNSLSKFVNNSASSLVATLSDDGTSLVWAVPAEVLPQPVEVDDAAVALEYPGASPVYYATLNDAVSVMTGPAAIHVLKDTWFVSDLDFKYDATLDSWPVTTRHSVSRVGDYALVVTNGTSLVVTNLAMLGSATVAGTSCKGETTLVIVEGPASHLTLGENARIADVSGASQQSVCGIAVWNHATFLMMGSARIENCRNNLADASDGSGTGAALMVDGLSSAELRGGTIVDCAAYRGAVCIANGSTLRISGAMTIANNTTLDGNPCNLVIHDLSSLVLDAHCSGIIGVTMGIGADQDIFGSIEYAGDVTELVGDVLRFTNDVTGDYGQIVRSADAALMVWSAAVPANDTYVTDDGESYQLVRNASVRFPVLIPTGVAGLVYTGAEQTGVAAQKGYALTGVMVATAAGSYQATATLADGYEWQDGSLEAQTVDWAIAPAPLTVTADAQTKESGAADPALTWTAMGLVGGETADAVLTGALAREEGESAGTYAITQGTLAANSNYALTFVPSTLTITPLTPTPTPEEEEVPLQTPFAFVSIVEAADHATWTLTLKPGTEYCKYTLYASDDLKTWAQAGETKTLAAGDLSSAGEFSFVGVTNKTARFWKVLGENGTKPVSAE